MATSSTAPLLPEQLKAKIATMSGHRIQLVIQKRLTADDVLKERLLIPDHQILSPNFLTLQEQRQLTYSRGREPIVAMALDPLLNSFAVCLKRFADAAAYAITTNWSLVMKRNREALVEGALLQLWSFRCAEDLCFAVVVAPDGNGGGEEMAVAMAVGEEPGGEEAGDFVEDENITNFKLNRRNPYVY